MWTGWLFPTYAPQLSATCKLVKTSLFCEHIRQLAFQAKIITCALEWSEIYRIVELVKIDRERNSETVALLTLNFILVLCMPTIINRLTKVLQTKSVLLVHWKQILSTSHHQYILQNWVYKIPCLRQHLKAFKILSYLWKYVVSLLIWEWYSRRSILERNLIWHIM